MESFELAYHMLPNTIDNRDVEDAMSLQDDEGFIDEMIEVPATSEDLLTFHGATTEEEEEGTEEAII